MKRNFSGVFLVRRGGLDEQLGGVFFVPQVENVFKNIKSLILVIFPNQLIYCSLTNVAIAA